MTQRIYQFGSLRVVDDSSPIRLGDLVYHEDRPGRVGTVVELHPRGVRIRYPGGEEITGWAREFRLVVKR